MKQPDELTLLHKVAHDAAQRFGVSAEAVFDPCGLILEMPPATANYWCTPRNAVTFASTGGDGVHYSYLNDSSALAGKSLIVMTLPSADESNLIVAESFEEFFSLGYYAGWFSLEQLVYMPDEAVCTWL